MSAARNSKPCTINPNKFANGGMNVLIEAVFDDGRIWLCRAGYVGSQYNAEFLRAMMNTTVTAMRYISEHTSLRIPEVYAYEGKIDEIGAAYMFLEPLEGISHMDMLGISGFKVDEMRIVSSVAAVMVQLSQLTFPSIGWLYETTSGVQVGPIVDISGAHHGPFATSVEYFNWKAKQASAAHRTKSVTVNANAALKSEFVCWLFEQAAPLLSERNNGPFPLMHPDVWGQQMLMDKEYNVLGVVDWDETGVGRTLYRENIGTLNPPYTRG
jgi:aminoglycoside phosphotransferase (APT) family kinase protein